MKKIGLISDEISSLPPELIKKFKIEVVPVKMNFSEQKTSSPPPGDFLKVYQKLKNSAEKILVITVSRKLSGVFNSALLAKKLFEENWKIFLFDSESAAAGEGLIVIKACELIEQEKEIEEILKELENLKKELTVFAFLKTLSGPTKTGRILLWQKIVFDILKSLGITPYIGIKEGKIKFLGFNTWTKNPLNAIFNQLKQIAKKRKIRVGINYTDNFEFAMKLKEKIEKELKVEVAFCSRLSEIVEKIIGPESLILAYHTS